MDDEITQLIDESIKLELSAADLYRIFSEAFPEDSNFWRELYLEETRHATLIENGKNILYEFPREILPPRLQELLRICNELTSLVKEYKETPPSRESALKAAWSLENSVGEAHYQRAMENLPSSNILELFQELNNGCKDHALRIHNYMINNRIQ